MCSLFFVPFNASCICPVYPSALFLWYLFMQSYYLPRKKKCLQMDIFFF